MGAQAAEQGGPVVVIGEQGATIAISAERLAREEAGRGRMRLGAELSAVQGGAERLGEIVEQE